MSKKLVIQAHTLKAFSSFLKKEPSVLSFKYAAGKSSSKPSTPKPNELELWASAQTGVWASRSLKFPNQVTFCVGIPKLEPHSVGANPESTLEKFRRLGAQTLLKMESERVFNLSVDFDSLTVFVEPYFAVKLILAFCEGAKLAAYQFDKYRSTPVQKNFKFNLFSNNSDCITQLHPELELLDRTIEAIFVTRDWSNEPSNYGTPLYFANEAKKWAKKLGLKIKVLDENQARKEKMNLFLAVGEGSERESQVVILEYLPKHLQRSQAKTIALVGKGVTFDSGGISIKPSARMEEMKHDMTGAATVMGAMILTAALQPQHRVIGVLALTENMPDGRAIQPGNVVTSRSGKTVEIINTDAEGRLVLADALDLVQDHYTPDAIVDIATLTGAVSIALGKHCCGIMGNDESLIKTLQNSSKVHFERMWELPLFDEYMDDLRTEYADMKNSANDGLAGTIRGGIFLKQFIKKNTPWAHLDISNTSRNMGHLSYFPKIGASGLYVRSLAQFCMDFK